MTPVIFRMALVAALLGATFFVVSVQPGSAGQPECITYCQTVAQGQYNACMDLADMGFLPSSACRRIKAAGFRNCRAVQCAK